jgi:hypothetical protein
MSGESAPFNLGKWFSGFVTGTTWAKALIFLLMAVAIIGFLASWPLCYHRGFVNGRAEGRIVGIKEGDAACRADVALHPTQTFSGPATVNNNNCPAPKAKWLDLGLFGVHISLGKE